MKRYWKIIVITLITVISIGTFYMQSSFASGGYPEFEFRTISGDENEMNGITIMADYIVGDIYDNLRISNESTTVFGEQGFFESLSNPNLMSPFNTLIKEYKKFMRQKDTDPANFYEDNEVLAYANIKLKDIHYQQKLDADFVIDVLNKKTEEKIRFQIEVPNSEHYGWLRVNDVQVLDRQLQMIVSAVPTVNNGNDLHVFTFDLNEKKLIDSKELIQLAPVKNGWTDIQILNESTIEPAQFHLIKSESFEGEIEEDVIYEDAISKDEVDPEPLKENISEIYLYHTVSKTIEKLEIPSDKYEYIDTVSLYEDTFFLQQYTENGLEVFSYDITNKKWGEPLNFNFEKNGKNNPSPFAKMMNGKLYIISAANEGYNIHICELHSGKTLYKGVMKVKDSQNNQNEYELYFFNMF